MGLAGDEQADRTVHGGIDKAIHHYPADHYDWWRGYLGDVPLLDAPGAFGENISTLGLDEENVLLGDCFRLGTALVEVTQARSAEHTSELQSLMRSSYAVFCLKKKTYELKSSKRRM